MGKIGKRKQNIKHPPKVSRKDVQERKYKGPPPPGHFEAKSLAENITGFTKLSDELHINNESWESFRKNRHPHRVLVRLLDKGYVEVDPRDIRHHLGLSYEEITHLVSK